MQKNTYHAQHLGSLVGHTIHVPDIHIFYGTTLYITANRLRQSVLTMGCTSERVADERNHARAFVGGARAHRRTKEDAIRF